MVKVTTPTTATTSLAGLTDDVEALLDPVEPQGHISYDAECGALLLAAGAALLAPPAPRPKKR
ncbi:hypothetical protein [Streptomyces sp. B6B3]|uniref:hypothetical protein n=1 Tax=Streptomyces sp. B6B3 TaxID=3153570 RepID=UPI00325D0D9C